MLKPPDRETQYGLPKACYADLLSLLEQVKPLRGFADACRNKKTDSRRASPDGIERLRDEAKGFEDKHKMTVSLAARTALVNGWPEHTVEKVLDLYRNSPERREVAPPLACSMWDKIKDDKKDDLRKRGYIFDHILRQERPEGPSLIEPEPEPELSEYALNAIHVYLDNQPFWKDRDCFTKCYFGKTVTEWATQISESPEMVKFAGGKNISIPEHVMLCMLAADPYLKVRPFQLKTLRGIFIRVPLDCPEEIRDREIARIVEEWKRRREEAGFDIKVRDTLTKLREDMELLSRRLRALLGDQGSQYRSHTTPAALQDADSWTRFVKRLQDNLQEEGCDIDIKALDELVEDARRHTDQDRVDAKAISTVNTHKDTKLDKEEW